MNNPRAPRCTFCGSESTWSAYRADSTEIGETWTCTDCETPSTRWDADMVRSLDVGPEMPWIAPEPLI